MTTDREAGHDTDVMADQEADRDINGIIGQGLTVIQTEQITTLSFLQ